MQTSSVIDEFVDFLSEAPSKEQLTEFHFSEVMQTRLRYLLDKNKEGGLTSEELQELDEMELLDHIVTLLKGRVFEKLEVKA